MGALPLLLPPPHPVSSSFHPIPSSTSPYCHPTDLSGSGGGPPLLPPFLAMLLKGLRAAHSALCQDPLNDSRSVFLCLKGLHALAQSWLTLGQKVVLFLEIILIEIWCQSINELTLGFVVWHQGTCLNLSPILETEYMTKHKSEVHIYLVP